MKKIYINTPLKKDFQLFSKLQLDWALEIPSEQSLVLLKTLRAFQTSTFIYLKDIDSSGTPVYI